MSDYVCECAKTKIQLFMQEVLDLGRLLILDDKQYSLYRSKVLRLGNNAMRELDELPEEENWEEEDAQDLGQVREEVDGEGV